MGSRFFHQGLGPREQSPNLDLSILPPPAAGEAMDTVVTDDVGDSWGFLEASSRSLELQWVEMGLKILGVRA